MPSGRSKEVSYRLCRALKDCLCVNQTLTSIELQGIPLRERDVAILAKVCRLIVVCINVNEVCYYNIESVLCELFAIIFHTVTWHWLTALNFANNSVVVSAVNLWFCIIVFDDEFVFQEYCSLLVVQYTTRYIVAVSCNCWRYKQWCIGGYTQVYAVHQPPGFLTVYTHLSDHK